MDKYWCKRLVRQLNRLQETYENLIQCRDWQSCDHTHEEIANLRTILENVKYTQNDEYWKLEFINYCVNNQIRL